MKIWTSDEEQSERPQIISRGMKSASQSTCGVQSVPHNRLLAHWRQRRIGNHIFLPRNGGGEGGGLLSYWGHFLLLLLFFYLLVIRSSGYLLKTSVCINFVVLIYQCYDSVVSSCESRFESHFPSQSGPKSYE